MEQMEPEDMGGLDLTPENVDTVLDEIRWDAWMQPWHCHPSLFLPVPRSEDNALEWVQPCIPPSPPC